MPSASHSTMPGTWVRRLSNVVDFRNNSDGNSSSYSSVEDNKRLDKQLIPSFMMNDDPAGRSYVDPWDMENYSFLRKQLEDINLSDNELSPALESAQSDFYYVPLDNSGSPDYQYRHYADYLDYTEGFSPQSYRDDVHGLMANVDEYDFYNEHLDTPFSVLQNDDSYMDFNNPSRQSERSRYNNQDYQTYTPPSIIRYPKIYSSNPVCKLRRRASTVTFRPETYTDESHNSGTIIPKSFHKRNLEIFEISNNKKPLTDVKIKLNRRKSFHVLSDTPDFKFGKMERRKSVLDHSHLNKWQINSSVIIPEKKAKEKLEKRKSIAEMSTELKRKPIKNIKESILHDPENKGSKLRLNVSFCNESEVEKKPTRSNSISIPDSSLVYVYETARRRRKMFLPNITSKLFGGNDFSYRQPEIPDAFTLDATSQYTNRPISRYTMTNYGHLKIDYSCSWNYLDQCIAQRLCL